MHFFQYIILINQDKSTLPSVFTKLWLITDGGCVIVEFTVSGWSGKIGGATCCCSLVINACDVFGVESKSWLVCGASVFAFASTKGEVFTSVCSWLLIALIVAIVFETGVGLLLIKLSTKADVTLGTIGGENVLAKGGTIGINGIGCGGLIVLDICGAADTLGVWRIGFSGSFKEKYNILKNLRVFKN